MNIIITVTFIIVSVLHNSAATCLAPSSGLLGRITSQGNLAVRQPFAECINITARTFGYEGQSQQFDKLPVWPNSEDDPLLVWQAELFMRFTLFADVFRNASVLFDRRDVSLKAGYIKNKIKEAHKHILQK